MKIYHKTNTPTIEIEADYFYRHYPAPAYCVNMVPVTRYSEELTAQSMSAKLLTYAIEKIETFSPLEFTDIVNKFQASPEHARMLGMVMAQNGLLKDQVAA